MAAAVVYMDNHIRTKAPGHKPSAKNPLDINLPCEIPLGTKDHPTINPLTIKLAIQKTPSTKKPRQITPWYKKHPKINPEVR